MDLESSTLSSLEIYQTILRASAVAVLSGQSLLYIIFSHLCWDQPCFHCHLETHSWCSSRYLRVTLELMLPLHTGITLWSDLFLLRKGFLILTPFPPLILAASLLGGTPSNAAQTSVDQRLILKLCLNFIFEFSSYETELRFYIFNKRCQCYWSKDHKRIDDATLKDVG